jgi:hypothetical protein
MSFWSMACLMIGLSMIAGGIVLICTIYMAVIGMFFAAMGALLCVGALESSVTDELEARSEAVDALEEARKEAEAPMESRSPR